MPLSHLSDLHGLSWDALRHALSVINEGIAVADPSLPDAPMVYVNDAFLRLTGYSREECLGRNCRFLQGPGTDGAALNRLRASLAIQQDCQVELLNYKKDGTPFWNLLSITHVWAPSEGDRGEDGGSTTLSSSSISGGVGGDGGISSSSSSGSDGGGGGGGAPTSASTPEQGQPQGKQLRYLIGVQSDVSDLARKAQAAQAARNRFIANMSHELRTPLNGILATAQLLLTSQLSPEQRELADTILDSSLSLLGTLGDILDFSLLEAAPENDGLALRHEPVCLQQALEGVAEMVAPAAASKGLELAFLIDPNVSTKSPHFWGDATRLRQVLHHLVSNAVKYSDKGEVIVCARLISGSSSGGAAHAVQQVGGDGGAAAAADHHLAISVKDDGIGMSPELQANLFQSFRQGSDALDRRYGGTGLGLALSKRLAEAMGGDIFVDSALGQGSTFTLVLRPSWCTEEGEAGAAAAAPGGTEAEGCESVIAAAAAAAAAVSGAHGSSGALSASDSVTGLNGCGANASSSDLSSGGSACGSPSRAAATGRVSLGSMHSMHPSSISSDLDPEGCICSCAQAHEHARSQLSGKTVWVDVPQALVEMQACQMLAQLGMRPVTSTARQDALQLHIGGGTCCGAEDAGAAAAEPAAACSGLVSQAIELVAAAAAGGSGADRSGAGAARADMAVVSACRVAAALRNGWRGRPLVVVGNPDELPERLHPLVVMVGKPLRLGRMVAALQRAAGMLSWQGGAENAPRLGRSPALLMQQQAALFTAQGQGGGAFGGGSGGGGPVRERWRQRASIDNSALRHSPMSQRVAAAAVNVGQDQQQQSNALGALQPPPLDLAGAEVGGRVGEGKQQGTVLKGLKPLTTAVKSVFSGVASARTQKQQQEQQQQQQPSQGALSPLFQQQQQQGEGAVAGQSAAASSIVPPLPPALPTTAATSATAAGQPPLPPQQQQQQPAPPPLTILIAEDNRVNQMVLLKVLKSVLPGCQPDVVANGLQVLEAVKGKAYDLIFMDVHMPEMDGVTASEHIRDGCCVPSAPRPRIVAVTADTLASLRQRCAEAGIEAFISKPFRVEDLKRVMERFGLLPGGGAAAGGGASAAAAAGVGVMRQQREGAAGVAGGRAMASVAG